MIIDTSRYWHRRKNRRKERPKSRQDHEAHLNSFLLFGCYFTDISIDCPNRKIKLDIEMYWYGIRCRNEALLSHAKHHFVGDAYQYWPKVSSQVIKILFHDPRFIFLGELKELAVRVARDHSCLSRKSPKAIDAILTLTRKWTQREFQIMLQEEFGHTRMIRRAWAFPPPNTWIDYEEMYRRELAITQSCTAERTL